MPITHFNARVQKHRDALHPAGLSLVQLWVLDTRRPGFNEECRRQCQLTVNADSSGLRGIRVYGCGFGLMWTAEAHEAAVALQGDLGKPRPALVIQADPFKRSVGRSRNALSAPLR